MFVSRRLPSIFSAIALGSIYAFLVSESLSVHWGWVVLIAAGGSVALEFSGSNSFAIAVKRGGWWWAFPIVYVLAHTVGLSFIKLGDQDPLLVVGLILGPIGGMTYLSVHQLNLDEEVEEKEAEEKLKQDKEAEKKEAEAQAEREAKKAREQQEYDREQSRIDEVHRLEMERGRMALEREKAEQDAELERKRKADQLTLDNRAAESEAKRKLKYSVSASVSPSIETKNETETKKRKLKGKALGNSNGSASGKSDKSNLSLLISAIRNGVNETKVTKALQGSRNQKALQAFELVKLNLDIDNKELADQVGTTTQNISKISGKILGIIGE